MGKLCCCFYSSFIFLTNILLALYYEYNVYAIVFLLLFITSIIVHSNYSIYTNIIDKISIFLVVCYGAYVFYGKSRKQINEFQYAISIIIVFTFLAVAYMYIYGYFTNQFCFDKDINIGNTYHSLLHIVSSLGHDLIMIM
jgi:hypothetical protein